MITMVHIVCIMSKWLEWRCAAGFTHQELFLSKLTSGNFTLRIHFKLKRSSKASARLGANANELMLSEGKKICGNPRNPLIFVCFLAAADNSRTINSNSRIHVLIRNFIGYYFLCYLFLYLIGLFSIRTIFEISYG